MKPQDEWVSYEQRFERTKHEKENEPLAPIRAMVYLAIKGFEAELRNKTLPYRGRPMVVHDYWDEIYIDINDTPHGMRDSFLDFVLMDDRVDLEFSNRLNDELIFYSDSKLFSEEYLLKKIIQFYNDTPISTQGLVCA